MFQEAQNLALEARAARAQGQPDLKKEKAILELFVRHADLFQDSLGQQRELLLTFPCCWDQLKEIVRSELGYLLETYSELYTEGWVGSELPAEFFQLPNLEHVSFSGCALESLAGEYARLKKLRSLGAEEVWTLRFIDDPSPALAPAIQELYFNACNLEVFPVSLYQATTLKKLSISYCHNGDYLTKPFTSIPVGLSNLERLEELELAGIGLTSLPEDLFQMKWLKKLNLLCSDLPAEQTLALQAALPQTTILLEDR